MTRPLSHRPLVLGFHPTSRGFGWAAFENPFSVHSFGVYTARGDKNASCLRKIEWLLERLEPEVFVIEAFDKQSSIRSERIRRLCMSVVSLAADRGAELAVYKRGDIERSFAAIGARTREEIAEAVARHLPALRAHLPSRRKQWIGEDKRLSVFGASALVLTHYHNGAAALLDDLRNAA
jgi:Holliday junction resolvasome RuvABC endonuclease subunit